MERKEKEQIAAAIFESMSADAQKKVIAFLQEIQEGKAQGPDCHR